MPIVSEEMYDKCMRTNDMDKLLAEYRKLGWVISVYGEEDVTEYDTDDNDDYIYDEEGNLTYTTYHVKYIYNVRDKHCACGGNLLFMRKQNKGLHGGSYNFEHCISCRKTTGPINSNMYKEITSKVEVL